MYKNLALVGATGAVGRIVLEQLAQREFPYETLKLLASKRSAGSEVRVGNKILKVELLEPDAFKDVDLVIASTPDEVSKEFAPWAVDAGALVVDESGYWRMDPNVPLVVPEVNPDAVDQHNGIIASPNCSTTQMVVALAPLHRAARAPGGIFHLEMFLDDFHVQEAQKAQPKAKAKRIRSLRLVGYGRVAQNKLAERITKVAVL